MGVGSGEGATSPLAVFILERDAQAPTEQLAA